MFGEVFWYIFGIFNIKKSGKAFNCFVCYDD